METQVLAPDRQGIEKAGRLLREGGLVAIPTETVYGLAADAFNGAAVAEIFRAKGRPQDNPLIVHISDISQISRLVSSFPEKAQLLAKAYWPGPMTIVLPKKDTIPDEVTCGLDTVGVRFPSSAAARAIIDAAGTPLAAPSANTSGIPSPTCAQHVFEDMNGRIPLIIDGGDCEVGLESTVISLAGGIPELLRPGGVTLEQLEAVLGEVKVSHAVLEQLDKGEVAASPGMKYKHYSPKAEVIIVDSSLEQLERYLEGLESREGVYALAFEGDEKKLCVPCLDFGAENDGLSQSHRLFSALRRADELNAKTIYARCPGTEGLGLAVVNRLLRAAGFRKIELGEN